MMKLIEDLGTKPNKQGRRKRYGIYECSNCHKHFEALTETVKARNQENCNSCASKLKNLKHGMKNHILNNTINNMIQRCENPNTDYYHCYGALGITVCDEWRNNRIAFFEWSLANGWKKGLSIDRKDVTKGYFPDNCRWTTQSIQAQNTRPLTSKNKSGYRGVSFNVSKSGWEANITVNGIRTYLGTFDTAEKASVCYVSYVSENNLEHNHGCVAQAMQELING